MMASRRATRSSGLSLEPQAEAKKGGRVMGKSMMGMVMMAGAERREGEDGCEAEEEEVRVKKGGRVERQGRGRWEGTSGGVLT